ncbi:MAG TPA: HEAT repeat domain-containing protein [Candidatus Elarobacter sp.]|nr:HEAT repeat domain-containing protein [Candidatus Elarobacter sp.]
MPAIPLLAYAGELLIPGIVLAGIGIILIGLTIFWPTSSKPIVTSVSAVETIPLAPNARGWEPEATGPVAVFARTISWPELVDPAAGELEDHERRRVIDGLGVVGDAWCAGILAKAFDEEEGDLRVAAIEALGQCDGEVVVPTLERAYASYSVPERYAAIDGASRRGDVALLERALRDTDGTVALAAAYGLHRANRNDLIESNLAGRTDSRANEIRRVLPILA